MSGVSRTGGAGVDGTRGDKAAADVDRPGVVKKRGPEPERTGADRIAAPEPVRTEGEASTAGAAAAPPAADPVPDRRPAGDLLRPATGGFFLGPGALFERLARATRARAGTTIDGDGEAHGAMRILDERTGGIEGRDVEYEDLAAFTGRAEEVRIAVIDTGVDLSHAAFDDNRVDAQGWDAHAGAPLATPEKTHGTSVAGIAAYGTDKVKVLGYRFTDAPRGGRGADYVAALGRTIQRVRESGARIVNMSFGCHTPELTRALREAIDANPDMLFLQAAGNVRRGFPRDLDGDSDGELGPILVNVRSLSQEHVITVGNVDRDGVLAETSVHGRRSVDLGAPGVEVRMPTLEGDQKADIGPWGGPHQIASGTSMSTPLVANVAAKMMSLCPSIRPLEAKRIILESVDRREDLAETFATGGIVNPLRAYRAAALLARAERGEDLDAAIAALPGGVSEPERARLGGLLRGLLAARGG